MDKETLSNYGWIVICVMILAVMLALATPFGNFIAQGFKSIYEGFGLTSNNALGIIIPGANGPGGGTPEEPHEPNTLYYYQPYRFDYEDGYILEMVFHKDGTVDGYMSQDGYEYGEVSYEEDTIAVYGEGTVTFMEIEFAISEDGTKLTANGLPDDMFVPEGILIPTRINKLQMDTPYRFAYSGGEDKIIFKSDGSAILNSYQGDEIVDTMEMPANTMSYFDEYYTIKEEYDDEIFIERFAIYPDGNKIIFGGVVFNICCNHANTRIENETADMTGDKYCNDCGELLQGSKPKVEAYMLVLDNTSDANNSYPMIIVKSETEIKAGDTYNSKTYGNKKVLSVYDGIEYEVYKDIARPLALKPTPTEIIPWNSEGSRVTTIVVEDTIKPIATDYWFTDFKKCTTVDLTKLDTSNTVSMISMFQSSSIKDASSLTLSASVLDVSSMFQSCKSIEKFPDFKNAPNITNMNYLFYYCSNLTQIPDLSYNTKVVTMEYTFAGCSSLIQTPDLSKNINVESLKCAFGSCTNITVAPNLSTMTKLTDVSRLFEGCTSLTVAPIIPSSVTNANSTFKNCKSLTGTISIPCSLTNKNLSYSNCSATIIYYHVDGCVGSCGN